MDAPTTTSADNGGSGGSGGDWGWFTPGPNRKRTGSGSDQQEQERDQEQPERIPSRPVSQIRPVGGRGHDRRPAPPTGPSRTEPEPEPRSAPAPSAFGSGQEHQRPAERGPGDGGPYAAGTRPAAPADRGAYGPGDGPAESGEAPVSYFARRPGNVGMAAEGTVGNQQQPPGGGVPAAARPQHQPASGGPSPAAPSANGSPAAPTRPAAASGGRPASPDAILLRRTMAEIEPIADKVTSYFYAMLFVQHPELRELFPASMDSQRDRLFKALLTAAQRVDDSVSLTEYLSHLGRGHRKYGTRPEHYPAVGEALLTALSRYAPGSWSAETEAAWVRAYTAISQIMIDAAAENERHAPAWWNAEVVAHDLRTPDIAIVTVRPDQPYPFRAGQYTTLETPWWPRVWRHYSFSSAPRSDGLLSFHVKAVPAGWVSNALVHRARPGDTIRLGPPGGSMTVDHNTDNGLLCLGGGTGIAPIKALVEDVAEHGRQRPVEVFYGARSDHDLYDIDTMRRLEKSHPWLSVRPVVSDGPTHGLSGPLPDAVRQYGPWNAYDAYLSGPPGMIRSGVDTLVRIGIPSHRIRHDSLEELVAAED
ncbi:globin domain-containing protein [Streptomyces sp. 8N706]|uniref:globin domain-containing protein n=1 Tax=Streptomyces sp. 8N706 TaxID=3457416 RepID=UPI003FD5A6F4